MKPKKKPYGQSGDVFIVEGYSAIEEYARFRPEAVLEIRYKAAEQRKAREIAAANGWSAQETDGEDLPQGRVFASVRVPTRSEAELFPRLVGRKDDLIVALDHISDPRNLGAIARSAAFFGVRELIAPKDRQVGVTGSAVGTAQGAFSLVDFFCVKNLVRCLEKLKEEGYWVIGTALGAPAFDSIAQKYDKRVLVLGSEDKGISPLVAKNCDLVVSIPGAKETIDSLNVSVAAGILFQKFQRS